MKTTLAAGAASMMLLLGAGIAEAQRITISPTRATGTENESLEFTLATTWRYKVAVEYRTIDGTATGGEDYRIESGGACLSGPDAIDDASCPGEHQPSPYVHVVHYEDDHGSVDAPVEPAETYRVEAWISWYQTGATEDDGQPIWRECPSGCSRVRATVTIVADEQNLPDIAGVAGFPQGESYVDEGQTARVTIRFEPLESPHRGGSVDWETFADLAREGDDFRAASGTFRFRACSSTTGCGSQEQTISIRTVNDRVEEEVEPFFIELKNADGAETHTNTGMGPWHRVNITDNDKANRGPRVAIGSHTASVAAGATVNEGRNASVTIRFQPAKSPHQAGSVRWRTQPGTADDDDFSSASGRFTIGACTLTASCPTQEHALSIRTRNDREHETQTENFQVQVYDPNEVGISDEWHLVTIVDDDAPNVGPTVSTTTSATSVAAGGTATLTATAADTDGTIASYAWRGAGTFSDDDAASTTWTAPSPDVETEYTLTVTVTDDDGATARSSTAITVAAATTPSTNAGNVGFTTSSSEVDEGESSTVTIRFEPGKSPHPAGSVRWRTQPGTAESRDYRQNSGTFSISACTQASGCAAQERAVTVRTVNDSTREDDDEQFDVELYQPNNVDVTNGLHEITIAGPNDQPLGKPRVNISDPGEAREGRRGYVTLTLDRAAPSGASVRYEIGDESEISAAFAGNAPTGDCRDYTYRTGTVSLGGRTTGRIPVDPQADGCVYEGPEAIQIDLYDPVGVDLEVNSAVFKIVNVRSEFRFASTEPQTVREGRVARFRIVRALDEPGHRVPASVEVHLSRFSDPQTSPGDDYESGPKTVSFSASQASASVSFDVHNDEEYDETGEGFEAGLKNAMSAGIQGDGVRVTIEDTDGVTPEIRIGVRALTPVVTEGEVAVCEMWIEEVTGRRLASTPADVDGLMVDEVAVFGPWNGRTRCLARLTASLLLIGAVFALAFACINLAKIGGPHDRTESGSSPDAAATATSRFEGTASTDADATTEGSSSAHAAETMSQPETTR